MISFQILNLESTTHKDILEHLYLKDGKLDVSTMSCKSTFQKQQPKTKTLMKSPSITAQKNPNNGKITSARLESYQVWSTAQSSDIKYHGYLEVRATLPAKSNGWNFEGAWPAIWMLGTGNGNGWPKHGEIDIVEIVNGNPTVYMSLHSTNHHGGGPQHPPENPYHLQNVDLIQNILIAGFEWNIHDEQIDLTWWFTWFDQGAANSWKSDHTTKVLTKYGNNDYYDFYDSFNGEGFSLLINLAEGGDWPSNNVFVDGQPQFMKVESVKVYGF